MGHINTRRLTAMSNGLADGISFKNSTITPTTPCVACTFGKQHRTKISTAPRKRATNILDLVHTDVCGPMRTPSIDGNRYFVTFIDDATNYCVISFIKQKSEVLGKFQAFVAMMANQTGKCVRAVRCDQGGEYTSHDWKHYCATKGIVMEYTAPHTPEHNGVAERRNLTLANSARCMMTHSGMQGSFWADAIAYANYINNRAPTSALDNNDTPIHAFIKCSADVSRCKVFGSPAAVMVEGQKGKFDL